MFPKLFSKEELNAMNKDTAMESLGIVFTEITQSYLAGKMPVDERTHQPMGILHGGCSVVLAESLGSLASNLIIDVKTHYCVGLEINANHLKSVKSGWVYGKALPIHIGRKTHVWNIEIRDENEKMVCVSRLTVAIIPKNA